MVRNYAYICTHNNETSYLFTLRPAGVVKLVDTPDLGSGASRCVGSSPITRTLNIKKRLQPLFLFELLAALILFKIFIDVVSYVLEFL